MKLKQSTKEAIHKLQDNSSREQQFAVALVIVVVAAFVGIRVLHGAHAAGPFASIEAESGVLSGGATVQSDTASSGGQFIQFASGGSTIPTTPSNGAMLLGFSTGGGQDPQDMQDTALLGRTVPLAEFFLDGGSFNASGWNMGDSLANYLGYFKSYPYRIIIGMPMLDSTGTLATCATGAYDTYYTQMAQTMVSLGYPNSIIRLGWEFNGTWYGQSDANTDPSDWVKCFQNESSALKTADPKLLIDFNPTNGAPAYNGNVPFDWTTVYPGDQYVDIIGMDTYDVSGSYTPNNNTPANTADEQAAWNGMVGGPDGLQEQVTFATEHHKLLSMPEWGVTSDGYNDQDGGDNPYYIQQMYNWMTSHNYYYESYFNVDESDGNHYLADFPNAEAEFKSLFTPLANTAPNNVAPTK